MFRGSLYQIGRARKKWWLSIRTNQTSLLNGGGDHVRRLRKVKTWRRIYLFVGTIFGNFGTFLVISFVRDLRDINVVDHPEETEVYVQYNSIN